MVVRKPQSVVFQAATAAKDRIIAAGEHGVIVLSDDGGTSWRQAKNVPTSVTVTALKFVGSKGWAVGHGGVILHTEDLGETWVKQADGIKLANIAHETAKQFWGKGDQTAMQMVKAANLLVADGPDKPLLGLDFFDENHGFVVGAYNLIFETTDGGKTWISAMGRLENPKSLHLYAIQCDGSNVYAAGEQGAMYRSGDGGRTFKTLRSPYNGSWFTLAIQANKSIVAAGLRGNAFISRDMGESWTEIEGPKGASILQATAYGDSVLMLSQAGLLLNSTNGEKMQQLNQKPLPPTNNVLQLPDGKTVTAGWSGVVAIPTQRDAK